MRSLVLAARFAAVLAPAPAPALAQIAPMPTPEDAAARCGRSGRLVEVEQGANIALELQTSPSPGGRWPPAAKPDFLGDACMRTGPANAPGAKGRANLGARLWNVLLFTANPAGPAPLTLERRGPGAQIRRSFAVTINAQ
jgi:hypothetical protein